MQHLGNCLDVVRLEICAQFLLCDEFLWFMEPVVPWCHWFWHMSSKTGCCMGYYLGFIRLDKLHVHMSTSPGVKSITSILPIYVEQLIVFCDLNPFRSSADERKGRAVLLLYVLIWNLYCMLSLVLKSMFYDHFSLQLKYRQWQNSRKPTCPCDVPREQARPGMVVHFTFISYFGISSRKYRLSEYLTVKCCQWEEKKKSRRTWIDWCQLSERQVWPT